MGYRHNYCGDPVWYEQKDTIYSPIQRLCLVEKEMTETVETVEGFEQRIADNEAGIASNAQEIVRIDGEVDAVEVVADSNRDQIAYLNDQFSDGRTGLVVDGGFFEETGIDKNYDGGVF